MGTEPTDDNVAPNGSHSVRVSASYHDYAPSFPVEPIIRRMLDSVPEKYLNGLSEVVLTNTSGLSRARRRSVTKSRKRKVRQAAALGLYHPAWKNQPAWIEIFVDNTLRHWEKGLWLKIPFMREDRLGNVLFHEIGHHIHYTARPEFREREDVADVWKVRLQGSYWNSRNSWLRTAVRALKPVLGPLVNLLYARSIQNQLRKRWISRAEFDERMK